MAEAGCIGIKFGLDSADSEVLRTTNKPLKVSRVASLIETARRLGIKTHMTVVLGLSGETKASLDRTFRLRVRAGHRLDPAVGRDADPGHAAVRGPEGGTASCT